MDKSQSALVNLRREVHLAIFQQMDIPSLFALLQTNRLFNLVCDPRHSTQQSKFKDWLLEVETRESQDPFSCPDRGFACYRCLRICPSHKLTEGQMKNKRRKGGLEASLRFCIDCGIPGNRIKLGGKELWICSWCGKSRAPPFCTSCLQCSSCFGSPGEVQHKNYWSSENVIHPVRRLWT